MLRKWSWRSGAITQVCWSFHLHIKCYLVSYGAQVGGGGSQGQATAAQKQMGPHGSRHKSWLPVGQLAVS